MTNNNFVYLFYFIFVNFISILIFHYFKMFINRNENQKCTFYLHPLCSSLNFLFYLIIITFTKALFAAKYSDIQTLKRFELTPGALKRLHDIYEEEHPKLWNLYSDIFADVLFTHFWQEFETELQTHPTGTNSQLITFLNDLGLLPEVYRKVGDSYTKLVVDWNIFNAKGRLSQIQVPPPSEMIIVPEEFRGILGIESYEGFIIFNTSISYEKIKERFMYYVDGFNPRSKERMRPFVMR